MSQYRLNQINLRKLIWRDPTCPLAAKVLLLDLLWYAGNNNAAFPSHKTLGDNHNLSSRYVRRMLNILKERNYINWKRSGFSTSNIYSFHSDLYNTVDEIDE